MDHPSYEGLSSTFAHPRHVEPKLPSSNFITRRSSLLDDGFCSTFDPPTIVDHESSPANFTQLSSLPDDGFPRGNRSTSSVGSALSYQSAFSLSSAFSQCSDAVMASPAKKGRRRHFRPARISSPRPRSRLSPRLPSPTVRTQSPARLYELAFNVRRLEEQVEALKRENSELKELSEERKATIANLTKENLRLLSPFAANGGLDDTIDASNCESPPPSSSDPTFYLFRV